MAYHPETQVLYISIQSFTGVWQARLEQDLPTRDVVDVKIAAESAPIARPRAVVSAGRAAV
jgi:hypothetical protein